MKHIYIVATIVLASNHIIAETQKNEFERQFAVKFSAALPAEKFSKAMSLTKPVVGVEGEKLYSFFENLYKRFNFVALKPASFLRIPKVIHQIWLNDEHSGKIPDAFVPYVKTCIEKHLGKDWKYKLWTDKDVEKLDLYNRKYYDSSNNYGVKSDLLKWEIIHKFGGVYLDTDIECLKSLEYLHYMYDFYVGIQPLETKYLQLGAGIFAARPGHPILKHCIETIKNDWHLKGTVNKTGPVHLTRSFYLKAAENGNIDIALPPNYFYPVRKAPFTFHSTRATKEDREIWELNGAFTIHHWSMSWMPKEYRQEAFKEISNDESCKTWNH